MYKHKLIFDDQVFEKGKAMVTSGATLSGLYGVRLAGAPGRTAITMLAADSDVVVASGSTITLGALVCATCSGSYTAANPSMATTLTLASNAQLTPAEGEPIMSLIVPTGIRDGETNKFVKATINCNDAAAEGTVDIIAEYLGN
jgi:hypothetical protein